MNYNKLDIPYQVKSNLATYKELDETGRTIKAIANTYNYFDYDGDVSITVEDVMTIDSAGELKIVFEDEEWGSTISFDPDADVELNGTLQLLFEDSVDTTALKGTTYQLFDWSGIDFTGSFNEITTQLGMEWDISDLYTTGEVTFIPEPCSLLFLSLGVLMLSSKREW